MKRLKLLVISLFILVATVVAGGAKARAITVNCNSNPKDSLSCVCSQPEAQSSATCQSIRKTGDPVAGTQGVIAHGISIVFFITGIASVIVIMLGAIQYMLSTGESAKVNKAKDTILYAVIGLMISVFAQVIVKFVINKF